MHVVLRFKVAEAVTRAGLSGGAIQPIAGACVV